MDHEHLDEPEGGDPPCWAHLFDEESDRGAEGRNDETPPVMSSEPGDPMADAGEAPCRPSNA